MRFTKSCFKDEFWGAKVSTCEYEVYEEYDGEVFDILKEAIEDMRLDEIPDSIEVTAYDCKDEDCENYDERIFEINPWDYLSDEQIKELKELLDEIWKEEE